MMDIGYQFLPTWMFLKFTRGSCYISGVAVTGNQIICEVAVTTAPVADHTGYHAIGNRARGVAMTTATDAA